MTEIEKKALALVNEVERDFGDNSPTIRIIREDLMDEALCRAIEKHEADKAAHAATVEGILKAHEAYKQDVSDAVEHCRACSDPEAWTHIKFELERFIISKPDPLADAWIEATGNTVGMEPLNEALAKRGLKIVEDV